MLADNLGAPVRQVIRQTSRIGIFGEIIPRLVATIGKAPAGGKQGKSVAEVDRRKLNLQESPPNQTGQPGGGARGKVTQGS